MRVNDMFWMEVEFVYVVFCDWYCMESGVIFVNMLE